MEYAPRGDIGGYIKKGKQLKREFPEEIVWNFFIQICLGVQVLNKKIKLLNFSGF